MESKKPAKTTAMENLSLDAPTPTTHFSRDLLQRFTGTSGGGGTGAATVEDEQGEGIELSLGLSLGGKFGVDKVSSNLMRSSSLASSLPVVRRDDNDDDAPPTPQAEAAVSTGGNIARTSSLPAESEEDQWRKRKELQCLRRMEAKRRRTEKQRNTTRSDGGVSRAASLSLEEKRAIELNLRERLEREKAVLGVNRPISSSNFGSSSSSSSNHGNVRGIADVLVAMEKGKESCSTDLLEPKTPQDMPCVFTKGDGPRGKRVDGILYKYGKGEQIKIMCVCHGAFHSPPEFIRHAGGTDVDHPLKHIVLNPNSSTML